MLEIYNLLNFCKIRRTELFFRFILYDKGKPFADLWIFMRIYKEFSSFVLILEIRLFTMNITSLFLLIPLIVLHYLLKDFQLRYSRCKYQSFLNHLRKDLQGIKVPQAFRRLINKFILFLALFNLSFYKINNRVKKMDSQITWSKAGFVECWNTAPKEKKHFEIDAFLEGMVYLRDVHSFFRVYL